MIQIEFYLMTCHIIHFNSSLKDFRLTPCAQASKPQTELSVVNTMKTLGRQCSQKYRSAAGWV